MLELMYFVSAPALYLLGSYVERRRTINKAKGTQKRLQALKLNNSSLAEKDSE